MLKTLVPAFRWIGAILFVLGLWNLPPLVDALPIDLFTALGDSSIHYFRVTDSRWEYWPGCLMVVSGALLLVLPRWIQ